MGIESKFSESLSFLLESIPEDSETFYVTKDLVSQLDKFFNLMRDSDPEKLDTFIKDLDEQPPLFREIGKLVRSFYDQLKKISSDIPERLGKMAHHDMEDASERLQHIVEMTENAANKTMDLSESIMNNLSQRTENYESILQKIDNSLAAKEIPSEVKETLEETQKLLQSHYESDEAHQAQLTEILIAQDYQDLTGQIINRIINLLTNLEQELVILVETFGKIYVQKEEIVTAEVDMRGPLHAEQEDRQSQGDVDDLLASFGF